MRAWPARIREELSIRDRARRRYQRGLCNSESSPDSGAVRAEDRLLDFHCAATSLDRSRQHVPGRRGDEQLRPALADQVGASAGDGPAELAAREPSPKSTAGQSADQGVESELGERSQKPEQCTPQSPSRRDPPLTRLRDPDEDALDAGADDGRHLLNQGELVSIQ